MSFTTYPTPNEISKNGGLLYWAPTSLATEAGYGTLLGYVDSLIFAPNQSVIDLTEEETGDTVIMSIYRGCNPQIIANLMNYNDNVLSRLFPGCVNATYKSITFPTLKTGTDLLASSSYYGKLLYVPEDTTYDPVILLRLCAPRAAQRANIVISVSQASIFQGIFQAKEFYYGLKTGCTL